MESGAITDPSKAGELAEASSLTRRSVLRGATGAVALGLTAGTALAQGKPAREPLSEQHAITISARPITHFERLDQKRRRFGQLEFRQGLVLTSSESSFGGWSGLVVEPDGKRLLAISDEGAWLAASLVYEAGQLVGLDAARMGPLRGTGGRALDRKRDLDAECLTLFDGNLSNGVVLIGFERNHRVGHFPIVDGVLQPPSRYIRMPPEARRMRSNKGIEALAVLQGGRHRGALVGFSERFPDNPAEHTGWIWINGEPRRLAVEDLGEFEVTDAASLPDGTLLLLERRFRWTECVKMRIRRFPAETVKPGAVLLGETLIEADLGFEIDNMEGLAAHRSAAGETVLTLISDNNFNSFLQRTILLQFTLLENGQAAQRRT